MATTFLNPSLIADSVATPPPANPLATAEGVARVRQLQEQTALAPVRAQQAQANVQETQLANQQKEQQLKDQQAFGKAMADSGGDPDKLVEYAAQNITDPWTLSRVEQTASTIRERNAQTTARQHADAANQMGMYYSKLQAIREAQDPAVKANLWKDVATHANSLKDEQGNPVFETAHFDPNAIPDDNTLSTLQTFTDASGKFHDAEAQRKERSALAAKNEAKANSETLQAQREDVANMYRGVASPEDHQAFIAEVQKKYPKIAAEYANLPYDPESTPDTIENMTVTAEQRRTNEYKGKMADAAMARASVAGGRAGLFARANDPTITDPAVIAANKAALEQYDAKNGGATPNGQLTQFRYLAKRSDADSKMHSELQQKEQDQWALQGRYGDVLHQAGISDKTSDPDSLNQTVKDPKTGRDITASEAINLMRASKAKAQELAQQQSEIRKREQWGEFAPKQPAQQAAPAAGPAPTAPPANAPATQKPTQGPVVKVFPRARLDEFAAGQNPPMTTQQAEALLLKKGYQVSK